MSGHNVKLFNDARIPVELQCSYCELLLKDPTRIRRGEMRIMRYCKECADKVIRYIYQDSR